MSRSPIIASLALVGALAATASFAAEDGPLPFEAVPAEAASPFGGMAISPTRIILENGGPGQQVTLYNSGGAPVSYRIEGVDMGLDAKGDYAELDEGAEAPWSALAHIRYAPRQVTLQPGERQSVRIIARAPRDFPTGEYRSHLRFSSIPLVDKPAPDGTDSKTASDQRPTVSVSVALDYRITIPILLRVGRPAGGSVIESATPGTAADGSTQIAVSLRRTGQRSDFGSLRAFDPGGKQIGVVAGISILPPGDIRIVTMPVDAGARVAKIVYEEELPGRKAGQILAEYVLP